MDVLGETKNEVKQKKERGAKLLCFGCQNACLLNDKHDEEGGLIQRMKQRSIEQKQNKNINRRNVRDIP